MSKDLIATTPEASISLLLGRDRRRQHLPATDAEERNEYNDRYVVHHITVTSTDAGNHPSVAAAVLLPLHPQGCSVRSSAGGKAEWVHPRYVP